MNRCFFIRTVVVLLIIFSKSYGQTAVPFDSPRWTIHADSAREEVYQDRKCLRLVNGTALLSDTHFMNGIIEFDIALIQARYFPGMRFRVLDSANGESYYLRPHQSGNPDAQQYYPEYNGAGGWQIYYGQGYNQAHVLPFDKWLHIKMLISGTRAEVYFDDERQPALYMHALKRPVAEGMIELQNFSKEPVRFANVSITPMQSVSLQSPSLPDPVLAATTIRTWEVSQPFAETAIDSMIHNPGGLHWQAFTADERGIADLSRLAGSPKGRNTVFCRLRVDARTNETRRFSFGFSDRIRVYCNGQLLYAGSDVFMSRDYRFLGTIGFFDTVFPVLKKGSNEIWLAVSEDFGGWGIEARLDNL